MNIDTKELQLACDSFIHAVFTNSERLIRSRMYDLGYESARLRGRLGNVYHNGVLFYQISVPDKDTLTLHPTLKNQGDFLLSELNSHHSDLTTLRQIFIPLCMFKNYQELKSYMPDSLLNSLEILKPDAKKLLLSLPEPTDKKEPKLYSTILYHYVKSLSR